MGPGSRVQSWKPTIASFSGMMNAGPMPLLPRSGRQAPGWVGDLREDAGWLLQEDMRRYP